LLDIKCLRIHCGSMFGQIGNDSYTLVLRQECGSLRVVWQSEEGIDCAQDGQDAFYYEELCVVSKALNPPRTTQTYPSPARKPRSSVHVTDCVCQEPTDRPCEHAAGIQESNTERQSIRRIPEAKMIQDTGKEPGLCNPEEEST
jgi:hypothetical protein